jgi:hypothetical protein
MDEISKLQQQLEQYEQAKALIAQLINRMAEIPTVFAEVVKVLNSPHQGAEIELISEYTQKFIHRELTAEQYTEFCQAFLTTPKKSASVNNYAALANRIIRGEMVLFIGSNLLQTSGQTASEESQLASILAKKIGYSSFTGTLSSIAELYQLLPEHGRISLLSELHKALPSAGTRIKLYDSLAKITAPLVLISSAYDNLLEQAFIDADKPYVELSSIIIRRDEYDIGHVVVRYSDDKYPKRTYIEEELSRLNVLKQGYSIIYKIRGTCKKDLQDSERDALTLSESNYFTFARYGKKIIPSYLSRQFRDRGFLFMGFSPKNWEDRLLVNILLKKRQYSSEACYTIASSDSSLDKMEAAYWGSRNVREYQANLQELEDSLAEVMQ